MNCHVRIYDKILFIILLFFSDTKYIIYSTFAWTLSLQRWHQELIVQQLICDICKRVVLEKEGESYLETGQFPISKEEAEMIDKEHRGHECHIEAVEKL